MCEIQREADLFDFYFKILIAIEFEPPSMSNNIFYLKRTNREKVAIYVLRLFVLNLLNLFSLHPLKPLWDWIMGE